MNSDLQSRYLYQSATTRCHKNATDADGSDACMQTPFLLLFQPKIQESGARECGLFDIIGYQMACCGNLTTDCTMGVTVDSPPLEDNSSSVSACRTYLSRPYENENGTLMAAGILMG